MTSVTIATARTNGNHLQSPTLSTAALELARRGFRVFPIQPRGKKPLIKQWQKTATTDTEMIGRWWQRWPTANIGLACGRESGVWILDRDGDAGNASYERYKCKPLETTLQVRTGNGIHHYIAWPDDGTVMRNSAGKLGEGLDVRGEGGYVVAPPSIHPSGRPYEWLNTGAKLQAWMPPRTNGHHTARLANMAAKDAEAEPTAGKLDRIPAGERNSALAAEAGALRARGMKEGVVRVALQAMNIEYCDPPLDEEEVDKIAASISTYPPQEGAPVLRFSTLGVLSETDLGQMFVAQHPDLRFVDRENTWYVFNGTHWTEDDICSAWNHARQFAVQIGMTRLQGRARVQSTSMINAITKVAAAHESVATRIEDLDTHPELLNTPAGTYNLDAEEWLEPQPEHLITRITAVAPDAKMPIKLFLAHLKLVTDGDVEYQDYLQRVLGYSLSGYTNEDKIFFLCGQGGNGKGTLMDNITALLGANSVQAASYARIAAPEVFMHTNHPQHPQALARLRGARLVTTSEVPEGLWNENLLKQVSGGGAIEARFMRTNSFEYTPQFKLIISGNHKPRLRNVDKAITRRFRLLPFVVDIEKRLGKIDTQMRTKKLKTEWPGILNWMIQGYQKYKERGLEEPKVVNEATASYLGREDALGNWLAEQCELTGNHKDEEALGMLYVRYSSWCVSNGELTVRNKRMFRDDLEARGIASALDKHTKSPVFKGIKLRPEGRSKY